MRQSVAIMKFITYLSYPSETVPFNMSQYSPQTLILEHLYSFHNFLLVWETKVHIHKQNQ